MRLAATTIFASFEGARRGRLVSAPRSLVISLGAKTKRGQTLAASTATWRSVWTHVMKVLANLKLRHGCKRDEAAAALKARCSQHYGRPDNEESDSIRTFSFDLPKLPESKAGDPILGLEYNCCEVASGEMDDLCPMVKMDEASGKLPKQSLGETKPKPEDHDAETQAKGFTYQETREMVAYLLMSKYHPEVIDFNPIDFYPKIAFFDFDFDEESTVGLGPPLHKLAPSKMEWIEESVNVISLKILESDVGYPISVYGTVLARDEIDFRCVYLFRRDSDNPQVITSSDDMLILIGPNRGLSATNDMFFEINLKIKDDGSIYKDFSRCCYELQLSRNDGRPKIRLLTSLMSTVEFVYTVVETAVEARVDVKFSNEICYFSGKVTAWTTKDAESHIILYDSEAIGTVTTNVDNDGSLALSRCLVAVPLDDELVVDIHTFHKDEHLVLNFGQYDEASVCNLGSYELQVKVTWTAGMIKRRYVRTKVA